MALAGLDAGAIEFLQKPTALATEKIFEMSDELIEKVKAISSVRMKPLTEKASVARQTTPAGAPPRSIKGAIDIVVIGISTGGPQALKHLIPQLPASFPVPVVMVLHMPVGYTELYAQQLDTLSSLKVIEARHGDVVRPGVVLLAPAGRHLTFKRGEEGAVTVHLDLRPFDTQHRPSVVVTFQSAAETFRDRTLGVVMTGMGSDGKQGAAWIKSQGGIVFTESEETCVVYGMPASVVEAGLSDKSLPLYQLAAAIQEAA
jgi:two-component system chemotaxis response regulator CheB